MFSFLICTLFLYASAIEPSQLLAANNLRNEFIDSLATNATMSTRRLTHGELPCKNLVDKLEVQVKDDKWKMIECSDSPVKKYERFGMTFDYITKQPVWKVCPLMFDSITKCSTHQDRTFGVPFTFKCENQVSHVDILVDDEEETVKCSNSSFREPNEYCRQFDLHSGRSVWEICPMSCPFSGCDKCANRVEEIEVLDKNSRWKTVDCKDKPGKDSKYCLQHNARTRNPTYMDCPLMCSDVSGCE